MKKVSNSVSNAEISSAQMYETEEEIIVSYYMPGFDEKNVKMKINNNMLAISGEMNVSNLLETQQNINQQQSYISFQQSLSLPKNVDINDIKKEFNDGFLKIRIPKKKT